MSSASPTPATLADELLARSQPEREDWLGAHQGDCTIELIAALKSLSDRLGQAEPQSAADATECAMLVAERCDAPLAHALAAWARGNWEMDHNPQQAIRCYQRALVGYRSVGDQLSVARLLTNLVFPLTECGRLAEAEAAADEARALLRDEEATKRYLMVLEQNAGWLLHNQGRYAEALDVYQRAIELAYALDDPASAAEIQVNRTITLEVFGHTAEEEAALLESRTLAERHGQRLTVARIDLNLGELYVAQGHVMEALRRLQAAHAGFAALENRMELASVLLAEAALFSSLGVLRDTRRCYTLAQELFAELGMPPQVGVALVRGAVANRRAGIFHTAGELLGQAARVWQELVSEAGAQRLQPAWQTIVGLEHAELLLAQGEATAALALTASLLEQAHESPALVARSRRIEADALASEWRRSGERSTFDSARQAYDAVLAMTQQIGDRELQRNALVGLGRLLHKPDPQAARAALEAALALDEETRQALTSEELKASFLSQRDDLLGPLVAIAHTERRPLDALAAIWRVKGGALLDVLHQRDRVPEPGDAAVTQARNRLAMLRWRHTLEAQLAETLESPGERADPHVQAAEDELRALLRLRQRDSVTMPWQSDPGQRLRTLEADVLIEYACCDDELVAVRAERSGDCRIVRLGAARAVAALLDDLQLHIQHVLTLPAAARDTAMWQEEYLPLLQALHGALIAPLGQLPVAGRVLIAPCDPLYLVPFAALHDGERYLVENHPLTLTPCAAIHSASGPAILPEGALILAASAAGRLGGVEAEVAGVEAALTGAELLYDRPNSIAAILARLRAPRVLHIAAHSVLREDAPFFSALQLHGELLSVEQCYELPLSGTALVTLSGCTTSAGLETGGSLLAFQSALFAAGAQAVLSSLWPIDDAMTGRWMARFYRLVGAGHAPDTALRATQVNMLSEPGWRHPAVWAAFACSVRPA